jgi:hypothetical protein
MQVNQTAIQKLHEEAEQASQQPQVATTGGRKFASFSEAFERALQEYYYDRPRCSACDHAQPPPGGPYCECERGQSWKKLYQRWAEEDKQAREAARKRRLEKEFGPMEVPPQFQGLTPWTMNRYIGEITKDKIDAIKAAAAWCGVVLAGTEEKAEMGQPTAERPGLFLYGKPGTGKSALAWWAVQKRGWGLWLTWNDLLGKIQNEWEGREALIEAAQNAPVLFLDDLGDPYSTNGRVTDDRRNILFRIINHRLIHQLPTIITSNLANDVEMEGPKANVIRTVEAKLIQQFDDRITDRLKELCHFVAMEGANLRTAPKKGV